MWCRTSDLLCTCTDASADLQPFWEAFPAANGGRTTYMFTYADADKRRPSFEVTSCRSCPARLGLWAPGKAGTVAVTSPDV